MWRGAPKLYGVWGDIWAYTMETGVCANQRVQLSISVLIRALFKHPFNVNTVA